MSEPTKEKKETKKENLKKRKESGKVKEE